MCKITIVMSTYNGSKYVEKQIDSILSQKGVEVQLYVRDDGSKDSTVSILKSYASHHNNIMVSVGENVGWQKSFMKALKDAPTSDYYAFADQDDIWFEDKLSKGIEMMKNSCLKEYPLMYHCNKLSVDENLKPFVHQVRRTPRPLNRRNAMIQEYAQGCSIILNNKAKELVTKYIPQTKLPHDFWCGLICYLFGKVIYDNHPRFYHITHGSNASGEGHMLKGWINRFKMLLGNGQVYYSPYKDLEVGYNSMLTQDDKSFIKKVVNYKNNIFDKLSLLFSRKFVRDSILGTISLKATILVNKL